MIVSNLEPKDVLCLSGEYEQEQENEAQVLLVYVHFYDLRGGGIEIEIKEDKQGLNTARRNKKRFPAQQILTQLEASAHNSLIWALRWLANTYHHLTRFGLNVGAGCFASQWTRRV